VTSAEAGLLALLAALQVKHLLADFVWQTEAMLRRKGIWGDPVGASHSALHAGLTAGVLVAAPLPGAGWIAAICTAEFVAHYHIDWLKARLTGRFGAHPSQRGFWVLLGLDQAAHQLTYVAILASVAALA